MTEIVESIATEKKEAVQKRRLQDEVHAAGEPVRKLKLDAHQARKALRDGRRLAKRLERDIIKLDPPSRTRVDRRLLPQAAACPS